MTAVLRKFESGARVLIHPCDQCGSDNAPFEFRMPNRSSRGEG